MKAINQLLNEIQMLIHQSNSHKGVTKNTKDRLTKELNIDENYPIEELFVDVQNYETLIELKDQKNKKNKQTFEMFYYLLEKRVKHLISIKKYVLAEYIILIRLDGLKNEYNKKIMKSNLINGDLKMGINNSLIEIDDLNTPQARIRLDLKEKVTLGKYKISIENKNYDEAYLIAHTQLELLVKKENNSQKKRVKNIMKEVLSGKDEQTDLSEIIPINIDTLSTKEGILWKNKLKTAIIKKYKILIQQGKYFEAQKLCCEQIIKLLNQKQINTLNNLGRRQSFNIDIFIKIMKSEPIKQNEEAIFWYNKLRLIKKLIEESNESSLVI